MKIEKIPTEKLIPYARNAKKHDAAQVSKLAGSIREFGFNNPVLIDKDNGIIAGHGRVMAAQQLGLADVPCIRLGHLTDNQRKAYILADNRLAEVNSGWDEELLKLEIADIDWGDIKGLSVDDFEFGEINFKEDEAETSDADAEPQIDKAEELRAKWGVEPGQLWELGDHRILCGDSTKIGDIQKLMGQEKAALLHADPPYGMGKEKDGVENDNLYAEKLDAFQMEWWRTFRPSLEDNASAYIWGNSEDLWRLWYCGGLKDCERLTFRSQIIWDKPPSASAWGSPIGSESMRSYPHGYEVCLFFMLGEQGFNNNADNYWDGWEPIRSYLETEMKRAGWSVKDLNKITGTQMAGHWVTKSQWSLIAAEHYAKIQAAARDHDAFKRDHDALKRDFYATRAYFDNTHENMTDVWDFGRVTGEERHGHATPKPVTMICRAIKSSSPKGAVVIEPFSGSGTTLMACEQLGRKCRAIEISPAYVAVAIQRWVDATGKEPRKI